MTATKNAADANHPSAAGTNQPALSGAQAAEARSLGYALLADLLARGVTAELRAAAEASSSLAVALAASPSDDEIAADHHHAFDFSAPPFEGAFLDAARAVGGACTESLQVLFAEAGFQRCSGGEDAEHLATALRCLGHLSGAESDAIEDGVLTARDRARHLAQCLLDDHVLRYAPLWRHAVTRTGRPFPSALAAQIEALLLFHRASLEGAPKPFALPDAGAALDHEDTDLRLIAERLATPARSGLVLSRDDIARIGRRTNIPRGFGSRPQLVLNLLRTAAAYDSLDSVLQSLARESEAQAHALAGAHYESIRPLVLPIIERLHETRRWLTDARTEARLAEGGPFEGDSELTTAQDG